MMEISIIEQRYIQIVFDCLCVILFGVLVIGGFKLFYARLPYWVKGRMWYLGALIVFVAGTYLWLVYSPISRIYSFFCCIQIGENMLILKSQYGLKITEIPYENIKRVGLTMVEGQLRSSTYEIWRLYVQTNDGVYFSARLWRKDPKALLLALPLPNKTTQINCCPVEDMAWGLEKTSLLQWLGIVLIFLASTLTLHLEKRNS